MLLLMFKIKLVAFSIERHGCLSRYWFTDVFERNAKIAALSPVAGFRRVNRSVFKMGNSSQLLCIISFGFRLPLLADIWFECLLKTHQIYCAKRYFSNSILRVWLNEACCDVGEMALS